MKTFFKLTTEILNASNMSYLSEIVKPEEFLDNLLKIIQERKIKEASPRDEDIVLAGLFDILGIILLKFEDIRINLARKNQFIQFLTHQGLFEKEKRMVT
jgi:hypothetical protein